MKTPTQRFVEKAIEGGWNRWRMTGKVAGIAVDNHEAMFLDPEAWKAVGKVEGWMDWNGYDSPYENEVCWYGRMHAMIDALASGKTIDEALESIIGKD